MNTSRLSFLIAGALTALTLSACGDKGDEVSYEAIAPGDECQHGGLRLIINDVAHVHCSGDPDTLVTTTHVSAGANGNPCFGDALHMEIQKRGAPTQEAWVCEDGSDELLAQVDPLVVQAYEFFLLPSESTIERNFACYSENEGREARIAFQLEQRQKQLRCAAPLLMQISFDDSRAALECYLEQESALRACDEIDTREDGTPIDFCNNSNYDEAQACREAVPDSDCVDQIDEQTSITWQFSIFAMLQSFSVCPFMNGPL